MSSCSSVLLEHSLALSRVLLIQICLIINKLPASMLRHLLMLHETLLQVPAEPVVQIFAIGTLQNVHVKHSCFLILLRDSSRPSHKATAWQATSLRMTRMADVNCPAVAPHFRNRQI